MIGAFYYLRIVFYMYFGTERDGLQTRMGGLQWAMLMGSALVMVLFNQGRVASVAPPRVNFDTRFNALQRDLLVSSFFAFMATTLGVATFAYAAPHFCRNGEHPRLRPGARWQRSSIGRRAR